MMYESEEGNEMKLLRLEQMEDTKTSQKCTQDILLTSGIFGTETDR